MPRCGNRARRRCAGRDGRAGAATPARRCPLPARSSTPLPSPPPQTGAQAGETLEAQESRIVEAYHGALDLAAGGPAEASAAAATLSELLRRPLLQEGGPQGARRLHDAAACHRRFRTAEVMALPCAPAPLRQRHPDPSTPAPPHQPRLAGMSASLLQLRQLIRRNLAPLLGASPEGLAAYAAALSAGDAGDELLWQQLGDLAGSMGRPALRLHALERRAALRPRCPLPLEALLAEAGRAGDGGRCAALTASLRRLDPRYPLRAAEAIAASGCACPAAPSRRRVPGAHAACTVARVIAHADC